MAENDEEQQNKSNAQEGGEEAARYGGEKLAKKLKGGAKEGAKEAGKDTAKQAVKEGGKKAGKEGIKRGAQAATAAETAGIGPAAMEVADQAVEAAKKPGQVPKKIGIALVAVGAFLAAIPMVVFIIFLIVIVVPFVIILLFLGIIEIGEASEIFTMDKTANVSQVPIGTNPGDTADVKYTITLTNHLDVKIIDITIDDPKCDAITDYPVPDLEPNSTGASVTFTCQIPTYLEPGIPGIVYTNTASAFGTALHINPVDDSPASSIEKAIDSALVNIGDPPDRPPTGCPIIGKITTPYGINIPDYPPGPRGSHGAVDISNGGSPRVKTTISGTATIFGSNSEPGGFGVSVSNSLYTVQFMHLKDDGRISGEVSVGDSIGIEGNSGSSTTGAHVHYIIINASGSREDPIPTLTATLNYTPPANNNFISFPLGSHLAPDWWGTCDALP